MPYFRPRQWELTPKQAVALQRELAERIVLQPLPNAFAVLGAADISYLKSLNRLVAVVLTFRWPSLERLETVHTVAPIRFPYVPGLLSFREIPPVLEAIEQLTDLPEVFLCDGQGIAHPRRLGLAAHLGLCLEVPTVGCAKGRLCGSHERLDLQRGNHAPLYLADEIVGCVFCSRIGVKPLYISPGHLADVDTSRQLVERCLGRYRIPEPLRQAHQAATMLRKSLFAAG